MNYKIQISKIEKKVKLKIPTWNNYFSLDYFVILPGGLAWEYWQYYVSIQKK